MQHGEQLWLFYLQPDFFVQFADNRICRALPKIDVAAEQCPFSRVRDAGFVVPVVEEHFAAGMDEEGAGYFAEGCHVHVVPRG